MVSGMITMLVAAATVAGPEAPLKVPMRYRVDISMTQKADLTAAGQGVLEGNITGSVFVTLTTSDTTDGVIATFMIDSMTVAGTGISAGQVTQAHADSLRGETLRAYIKDGKVEGSPELSAPDNAAMNAAAQVVNLVYPGIGSKARDARSFSDTTSTNTVNEQGTRNSHQVVDWTVTGNDGDAMMLSGKGAGTVTADVNGQQVSGTVATTIDVTSPVGGPASKGVFGSEQDLIVLVPGMAEPVDFAVESTATLTPIP